MKDCQIPSKALFWLVVESCRMGIARFVLHNMIGRDATPKPIPNFVESLYIFETRSLTFYSKYTCESAIAGCVYLFRHTSQRGALDSMVLMSESV